MEGSPSQEASRYRRTNSKKQGSPDSEECLDENTQGTKDLLSQIESDFLREFEHAEELAKTIEPGITLYLSSRAEWLVDLSSFFLKFAIFCIHACVLQ